MSIRTFVYFKSRAETSEVAADVSTLLSAGETITSVDIGIPSPVSSDPLSALLVSDPTNPVIRVALSSGDEGVTYGFVGTVTTSLRVFDILFAVTVSTNLEIPYVTLNPEAFSDLIDTIEAGNAAIATAPFAFPTSVDPTGGFVIWELLDSEGNTYANGNAFEYLVQSTGISNSVIARAVVSVPSSVPPSLEGQKYVLRWTLSLDSDRFYSFENITVVGLNTVPLGTQPSVELVGDTATVSIVIDKLYDNVTVELYNSNDLLVPPVQIPLGSRVGNGYYFSGYIDTTNINPSVDPYTIVWKYWDSRDPRSAFRESASFWVVTPTMMQAVDDVKAKVQKARAELYGGGDLLFPISTIMMWLRRAKDAFNGGYGIFTSFTMTNARGPIREFWLLFAELMALESQYLAEGEKSFNFSGQSISLDVDRTQYFDNAAEKIRSRLQEEFKPFKTNLTIKGNLGGDGSVDPSVMARGANGGVGITISPATPYGRYLPPGFGGIR